LLNKELFFAAIVYFNLAGKANNFELNLSKKRRFSKK
jgi:hypothetical protein